LYDDKNPTIIGFIVFFQISANLLMFLASTTDPGIIPKLNLKWVSEKEWVPLPQKVVEFDSVVRNQHQDLLRRSHCLRVKFC
jgi:hypothetical protein